MNKFYIIGGLATVATGCILGYALYTVQPSSYIPVSSESKTNVPAPNRPEKVATWDTCTSDAETEYRAFVVKNGKPTVDKYGSTSYDLTQSDRDTLNKKRASQIDTCANTYRDQVH